MPPKIPSKIFIDGGDPAETAEAKKLLGYIDGQTTNPTLVAKNPKVAARIAKGEKFTGGELTEMYQQMVEEIAGIVDWSVSIEPYVDKETTVEEVLTEARRMNGWTPKAWIKFPTTLVGLEAASQAVKEGMKVNMTLCFAQEQAAAVYTATWGYKDVFVSPFVGRLDDRGENGMQLIANILKMFEKGDGHVLTLTASVRTLDHFLYALMLKSPIITVPFKVFKQWADVGFTVPDAKFKYPSESFKSIPYQDISLENNWMKYNIRHDLTDTGIDRFSQDWNNLVK